MSASKRARFIARKMSAPTTNMSGQARAITTATPPLRSSRTPSSMCTTTRTRAKAVPMSAAISRPMTSTKTATLSRLTAARVSSATTRCTLSQPKTASSALRNTRQPTARMRPYRMFTAPTTSTISMRATCMPSISRSAAPSASDSMSSTSPQRSGHPGSGKHPMMMPQDTRSRTASMSRTTQAFTTPMLPAPRHSATSSARWSATWMRSSRSRTATRRSSPLRSAQRS